MTKGFRYAKTFISALASSLLSFRRRHGPRLAVPSFLLRPTPFTNKDFQMLGQSPCPRIAFCPQRKSETASRQGQRTKLPGMT